MKKKIALTAVIIFVLASAGYGTYAYMTASKTAQNIITAGTVEIDLNGESEDQNEGSEEIYKASEEIKAMPSTEAQREVNVKNTGKNACYVRVKLNVEVNPTSLASSGKITLKMNGDNWVESDGFWYYKYKLEPKNPNNMASGMMIVKFDASMGNEYQNATVNVSIIAQAVQTANNGFATSVLEVKGWPSTPAPSPSDAG